MSVVLLFDISQIPRALFRLSAFFIEHDEAEMLGCEASRKESTVYDHALMKNRTTAISRLNIANVTPVGRFVYSAVEAT